MLRLKIALSALFFTLLGVASAIAQKTLEDPNTICAIEVSWDGPETSVRWDGACVDGKPDGAGELIYYAGDEIDWIRRVGEGRGVSYEQGNLVWSFPDDISYQIKCKGDYSDVASLRVATPVEFELGDSAVLTELLNRAREKIESKCNSGGFSRVVAKIYPRSGGHIAFIGIDAKSTSINPIVWTTYNDYESRKIRTEVSRLNGIARKKREAAAALEQQARETAENRRRLEATVKRFNDFSGLYSLRTMVLDDRVHTNPFTFLDMNIAVRAKFAEMISSNRAIVMVRGKPIAITGINPTTFSSTKYMLLAVRLTGKGNNMHSPIGEVFMTEADYLGHVRCDRACSQYLRKQ